MVGNNPLYFSSHLPSELSILTPLLEKAFPNLVAPTGWTSFVECFVRPS